MITRHIDLNEVKTHLFGSSWPLKMRALSKAITLIENNPELSSDNLAALVSSYELTTKPSLDPAVKSQNETTHIVGLTGFPGAGKSTLVNLLVKKWRLENKKIAVLAIDPSSTRTGGAVLGDRIRMQDHFKDEYVYIRSMGSHGTLGGLSQHTHKVIELLKKCEFDKIIVETVGVGQSEAAIVQEAQTVILVLLPNTGDEIQFMKAGVIQSAHIFVINKIELSNPFHMMQELEDNEPHPDGWKPPVVCTSAIENKGIETLVSTIEEHKNVLHKTKAKYTNSA